MTFDSNAFVEKMNMIAGKISSQRHMNAIRESFIYLMPLIIAASFFVLVNNVILNTNTGLLSLFDVDAGIATQLQEIGNRVYQGTLNLLAILITLMLSYRIAKSYNEDGIIYSAFAVASLVIFFPMTAEILTTEGTRAVAAGVFTSQDTSAAGMFVGILVAIVSTELLYKIKKVEAFKIKMPDSVPPAVVSSLNAIIPMILLFSLFGISAFLLNYLFDHSLGQVVNLLIQTPLQSAMQGLTGLLVMLFTINFLWFLGIHGVAVLMPITEPTLLIAIQQNASAFAAGLEMPHIVTKSFVDAFCWMGGGGQTIGLIAALWIAGKREQDKAMTKIATAPAFFNINEPLIFGLPIIFNPLLVVPLILTPLVSATIAYSATAMGLISKTSVLIPWTTPPVLSAFLATGGDYRAAILALGLIVISTLIYLPFVILMGKKQA